MRILLVEPDLEDNGALRVSLDRADRWTTMGAEVSALFVSSYSNGGRAVIPQSIRTVVANSKLQNARWMLPGCVRHGFGLASAADVIVAGREIASGLLIGTMLAKLARRPLAVTIHSNVEAALDHHGTTRHRRNALMCLKMAARLVPVSPGLVPGLVALGMVKDRIRVVENGVDADRIKALSTNAPAVDLPPGPMIMGLGRLSHEKGFDHLIRAHAQALREGALAHSLVIAGHGPDRKMLTALAEQLGVGDTVCFTGFLDNPYAVLARSDLFVLSSRYEGFGLALAEAMVLETPAIAASCIAGPAEILGGGRFGDLVPVADEAALARAIARHLRNPQRLRSAAIAGARYAQNYFAADTAASRHLQILKNLTCFTSPSSVPVLSTLG